MSTLEQKNNPLTKNISVMKNSALIVLFTLCTWMAKASELFLRMEIPAVYTVSIGDQSITNSTGRFRFFDLPEGNHRIYVFNGMTSTIITTQDVYLANNVRTILFMNNSGLITTQGNYSLGVRDWFDTYLVGTPMPNGNGGVIQPQPSNPNADLNRNFVDFIKYLQDTHTDQKKLEKAKEFISHSKLTAEHVEIILRTFSFDTYRTQFAIYAYDYLTDQHNYFIWKGCFDFKSNYDKVEQSIKAKKK